MPGVKAKASRQWTVVRGQLSAGRRFGRALFIAVACGCVASCASKESDPFAAYRSLTPSHREQIPVDAPKVLRDEFRRADDPSFSLTEREMITTALRHLAGGSRRFDAYYAVRHRDQAYFVEVLMIDGYSGNCPREIGVCTVGIGSDGKVAAVLRPE